MTLDQRNCVTTWPAALLKAIEAADPDGAYRLVLAYCVRLHELGILPAKQVVSVDERVA